MERIEALIAQLKEQLASQADPAQMMGTVQLLQFELGKLSPQRAVLGTAKVAVMLPATPAASVSPDLYEKYAPRPVEKTEKIVHELKPVRAEPEPKQVKETLLVEEGAVSVVQKNGQLDMVFDPMTEIPTLSHQAKEKLQEKEREVNDAAISSESLNDKLKQGKTELIEVLKDSPVKDLRKAIGINDRFLLINELFRGDEDMYERCIKTINNFHIYAEAEYWISRELKVKLGWSNDQPAVQYFDQLVKRRFS